MEKVRLGLVGPGRIVYRVMKDLRKAPHIDVAAVASRSMERSEKAKQDFDLQYAFDSYEAMAKSDVIDMAYIALPHPFHCAVTKLFLENGKHVICEKPFAVNAKEAREMIDCAKKNGRFLMEAMWTRFFPMSVSLKQAIAGGEFGDILRMTGSFSFRSTAPLEDRTFNRELGGGSLLDVGVYPLSMMCYFKDALPEKVQTLYMKGVTEVDDLCSFQLQFADGGVGQGFSALNVTTDSTLTLYGTKGWVVVPNFWHPTEYIAQFPGKEPETRTFPSENEGFWHEFEYAANCILRGETDQCVIPLEETVKIMEIMDGMRAEMGVTYPGE